MKFNMPCDDCAHNNVCCHKQGMEEAIVRIRENVEGPAPIEVRITCKVYLERERIRSL